MTHIFSVLATWLLYIPCTVVRALFCKAQASPFNCPCTTYVFHFGLLFVLFATTEDQPVKSVAPALSDTSSVCKMQFSLGLVFASLNPSSDLTTVALIHRLSYCMTDNLQKHFSCDSSQSTDVVFRTSELSPVRSLQIELGYHRCLCPFWENSSDAEGNLLSMWMATNSTVVYIWWYQSSDASLTDFQWIEWTDP